MKKELIVNNEEYIELNGEETVEVEKPGMLRRFANFTNGIADNADAKREAKRIAKESKESDSENKESKKKVKKILGVVATALGLVVATVAVSLLTKDDNLIDITTYETETDENPEEEETDSEETEEKPSEE